MSKEVINIKNLVLVVFILFGCFAFRVSRPGYSYVRNVCYGNNLNTSIYNSTSSKTTSATAITIVRSYSNIFW